MISAIIKCFLILKAKIKHQNMVRLDREDISVYGRDIVFWYNVPLKNGYTTKVEIFTLPRWLKGAICND